MSDLVEGHPTVDSKSPGLRAKIRWMRHVERMFAHATDRRTLRRALSAIAVLALAPAACGGGDDSTSTSDVSGAGGAAGPTAEAGPTAKRFNELAIPDQIELVDDLAAADPACSEVEPDSDRLRQAVFINAVQAPPDASLTEIVADACGR